MFKNNIIITSDPADAYKIIRKLNDCNIIFELTEFLKRSVDNCILLIFEHGLIINGVFEVLYFRAETSGFRSVKQNGKMINKQIIHFSIFVPGWGICFDLFITNSRGPKRAFGSTLYNAMIQILKFMRFLPIHTSSGTFFLNLDAPSFLV